MGPSAERVSGGQASKKSRSRQDIRPDSKRCVHCEPQA